MRIGVAGCFHETNTFAPALTTLEAFEKEWFVGDEFVQTFRSTKTSMGGVIHAAEELSFDLVPLVYTQTVPSGTVCQKAADTIIEDITRRISDKKEEIDALVLILHGAMVSENDQDVDGTLIKKARQVLNDKPICVTIDLHANVSEEMVRASDLMIGYDTYPHVDAYDRAVEVCHLLVKMLKGEINPVQTLFDTQLLMAPTLMNTEIHPMKTLMEKVFDMEKKEGVLDISVVGGFAYADVFCASTKLIILTDGQASLANRLGQELVHWIRAHQRAFKPNPLSLPDAYKLIEKMEERPVILIESSDNVGGGAPADATHTLRFLIERRAKRFLMVICDEEAVREAFACGVGQPFAFEIGGKTDMMHGKETIHGSPVFVQGTVRLLFDGRFKHKGPYMSGMWADMGHTAVVELLETASVIMLTERRVAPWDINHVRCAGVNPEDFHIIVVKSAVAWRSAFGSLTQTAIEVDTPGACSSNLEHFKYKHLNPCIQRI